MRWIALAIVLLAALFASIDWLVTMGRYLIAILLVCFLPGFLVLRALLPRKPLAFSFFVISIGTSVSITIVSGLLLNVLHILNVFGWTVWLGAICLAALWFGRHSDRPRSTFTAPVWHRPTSGQAVCALTVLLLLMSAIGIARYGSLHHRQFAYTELWMLPSDGRGLGRITVGVKNEEQKSTSYDLEVLVNDRTVKRWPRFLLRENESRVEQIPINLDPNPGELLETKLTTAPTTTKAGSDLNPCDTTVDQPEVIRTSAGRLIRNPCDTRADQRMDAKPSANNRAERIAACDPQAATRGDPRFGGARIACDQQVNQRAGLAPGANRDRTQVACNQIGDRMQPGCDRMAAANKFLRQQQPCDQQADFRKDVRPGQNRADRPGGDCDQNNDTRIEARLYKDGNLAFLYRNVWLGQPAAEAR